MNPTDLPSTARAISPDSAENWTMEGPWTTSPGVHRLPLPLPNDGLRAVNVYALVDQGELTLIDGGWAIPEARAQLERQLRVLGFGIGDISQILVTHIHRDHYTLASQINAEYGVPISIGIGERPTLESIATGEREGASDYVAVLREAGAERVAGEWLSLPRTSFPPSAWRMPTRWIDDGATTPAGGGVLEAIHTPGHTRGHLVYRDAARGLLFSGDHVLPTITPSLGYSLPLLDDPLGMFLESLRKVRGYGDSRLLAAHGPVASSVHARVDELLAHHERRLQLTYDLLRHGADTAFSVAEGLTWTRRETPLMDLDAYNRGLAIMETRAHLILLVARGRAGLRFEEGVARYSA